MNKLYYLIGFHCVNIILQKKHETKNIMCSDKEINETSNSILTIPRAPLINKYRWTLLYVRDRDQKIGLAYNEVEYKETENT